MNMTYLRLEILRLVRNKRILIVSMLLPTIMLLIIGSTTHGNDDHAYIMTSMGLLGAMSAALSSGGQIAVDRGLGWNRTLRLTALSPRWYVLSKVALAVLLAVPPLLATFAVGALAMHVRLSALVWLEVFAGSWLSALPFAALGVFIGYLAKSDSVQQFVSLVYLGLAALGGLWIPIEVMPHTMRQIASWTPTYWAGQVARSPIFHKHISGQATLVLLGWTAVLGLAAARRFRADTARA